MVTPRRGASVYKGPEYSKRMGTKIRRVQMVFCGWKVEFQGRVD